MRNRIRQRGALPWALLLTAALLAPSLVRAADRAIEYAYDDLDRVTRVDYIDVGDTTTVSYTYDFGGNIVRVTVGPPPGSSPSGVADAAYLLTEKPAPNPFNARVCFGFELKAAQRVIITLYDVRGRLVRTLLDEEVAEGRTRVFWDGRDGRGADVASGVYLVRLATEHRSSEMRVLLVR
jgi:hypothetical protein